MASFTLNGCRLFYEVTGKGKDLIFLHGLGADRRQATAATQQLQGCRVISIDMPGHGDSDCRDAERFGFSQFTDVALALLDELGVASAVWGGISMGSGICLQAALRNPERVEGLLLVRPAWLDAAGLPNLAIVAHVGEWISALGIEEARKNLLDHEEYRRAEEISRNCADSVAALLTRSQAVTAADVLLALVGDRPFDSMQELAQLTMPSIVFGNRADRLHPLLLAKQLADAMPQSDYVELPPRYTQVSEHASELTKCMQQFLTS